MTRRDLFKAFAGAFAGVVAGGAAVKVAPRTMTAPKPFREMLTGQQLALLECRSSEIELIGPRGCGKTWALARWLADPADDPGYRGLFACKCGQSEHIAEMLRMVRSKDFGELKYRPSEQCIIWPSGARVVLCTDLRSAWGHTFQRAAFDNALESQLRRGVRINQMALVQNSFPLETADAVIYWHDLRTAFVMSEPRCLKFDPNNPCGLGHGSALKTAKCTSHNPPPPDLIPCMRPMPEETRRALLYGEVGASAMSRY
jgi:hypothetical protein